MSVRHAILGLLSKGERHGYSLQTDLAAEFGSEWLVGYGQLYRLLDDLRRKGWVTAREGEAAGGPKRKVYQLAEPGLEELRRWLADPEATVESGRDSFGVKLSLGLFLNSPSTVELLNSRRRALEAQRAEVQAQWEHARASRDGGRWLIADARLRQIDSALASLPVCRAFARHTPTETEPLPAQSLREPLLAVGSDDRLLEVLGRLLTKTWPGRSMSLKAEGSLAGLLALRDGRAHLAGTHLLDPESGEYNVPFVRNLLFEEPVLLVNLSYREQGLLVAPGNPKSIGCVADLAQPGVRIINRQKGAGTRALLHHQLALAGVKPRSLDGYDHAAPTHDAVAAAVSMGIADAGPAIRSAALAWGLDFIPIGQERFDLAVRRHHWDSDHLAPLVELLAGDALREAGQQLVGYDLRDTGEIMAEI